MGTYEDILSGIKRICETQFNGNQKRMAETLGIQQPQLNKFLNRKSNLRINSLAEILDKIGAKIVFPDETPDISREVHFVKPRIVNAEEIGWPVDEDYLAVPLASMPVAAGPGIIPEEKIQSWVLVWRSHESVRHRSNLVAVEIGRDQRSMEPTLHPGDIVLIDRNDFIPKSPPGNIYLVRFPGGDGEAGLSIKRVQLYSKNKQDLISFYSDNPQYPPDIYDLNVEYDGDIKRAIVGRVVWAWSDMSKK